MRTSPLAAARKLKQMASNHRMAMAMAKPMVAAVSRCMTLLRMTTSAAAMQREVLISRPRFKPHLNPDIELHPSQLLPNGSRDEVF